LNRKLKILLASLLIATIITTVYAAVKFSSTLPNSVTVKGYEIKLWRFDTNVEATSISWGTMDIGSSKDSDIALELPTTAHKLGFKNTGDYLAYIGWKIDPTTPLPTGFSMTGWHTNTESEPYQQTWGQNTFTFSVAAGSYSNWRVRWVLSIDTTATKGTYSFSILLLAADSSSG